MGIRSMSITRPVSGNVWPIRILPGFRSQSFLFLPFPGLENTRLFLFLRPFLTPLFLVVSVVLHHALQIVPGLQNIGCRWGGSWLERAYRFGCTRRVLIHHYLPSILAFVNVSHSRQGGQYQQNEE